MRSKLQIPDTAYRWIMVAAIVYCIIFAIQWMGDPLARLPQADAKENLTLAYLISRHSLPLEPFYRAMLYPWILSFFAGLQGWAQIALFAGLGLHILAAFQVRHLTLQIWESDKSGLIAFLLYILNPASLFFSLQVMDMTLAIVLFLGAMQCLLRNDRQSRSLSLAGGLLAGLACLARPHFLPAALVLILLPLLRKQAIKERTLSSGLILAGLSLMLLFQGILNYRHAGEFRILPWQGPYNLYAANREGANGLYYGHTMELTGETYLNAARRESELIYESATGETVPFDISRFNRFWKDQFKDRVAGDPLGWARLIAFKAYAVLNSYEQYNNLTFSYHKERFPLLRYNPMNWGILLILGSFGAVYLASRDWKAAAILSGLILAYSVSLILYYASARFRLPLAPVLAVFAGGIPVLPGAARLNWRSLILPGAIGLLFGLLTFSSFAGIRDEKTYLQDRLLLAGAHSLLGNDLQAAELARTALKVQPKRHTANVLYLKSYLFLRMTGDEAYRQFGEWEEQKKWIKFDAVDDPDLAVFFGFYLWNWDMKDVARDIWQDNIESSDLARRTLAVIDGTAVIDDKTLALQRLLEEENEND